MNYDRGMSQLLKHLKKTENILAYRKVTALIKDPGNLGYGSEELIDELNRISYRSVGTSFTNLCENTRLTLLNTSSWSLKGVLLLILVITFLPAFGIAFAASASTIAEQRQIYETRQRIEAIDTRIGRGVTSNYYLSYASPCTDWVLENLEKIDSTLMIEGVDIWRGDHDAEITESCIWIYKDAQSGTIIAKDIWYRGFHNIRVFLQTRMYFSAFQEEIAIDHFASSEYNCFRYREYRLIDGRRECYNEAGELISASNSSEKEDLLSSSIPPMAYWFLYR